jgi:hypothetical protein
LILDAIFGTETNNIMKKLLPFLIVPIMFSCVSQKKYTELESQNSAAIDYDKKLDEILQMRMDAGNRDENMHYEIQMRQIKEEIATMKTLNQLVEEGSIKNISVDELQEIIRRQSEERAHMSVVNERDMMNRIDTRKSIEKEAIAMLVNERIVQKHPTVSVSIVFETCLINVPNSVLFGSGNSVTNEGLDILKQIRQTADFREGIKITVKLSMIENEIKDEDRKKANSIYTGLMNVSTRMQKDIAIEFTSDGKTGDVIFEIE